MQRLILVPSFLAAALVLGCATARGDAPPVVPPATPAATPAAAPAADPPGTWYFAVSGDSRDCGDLIMPKIAAAVRGDSAMPARFYWHLGDLRRSSAPDCDVALSWKPDWDCGARHDEELGTYAMDRYLDMAWDDAIKNQLEPFGDLPVYLARGNHEVRAGHTLDEYRDKFQRWLTAMPIHVQRTRDWASGVEPPGHGERNSYYHLVVDGVDLISLDNADEQGFSAAQLRWLRRVLDHDAHDPAIHTIVVGMHAALPFSRSRDHAMDSTCQGQCSGQQAYDLLFRATQVSTAKVYVLASHAHYFQEDLFGDQPEHVGQVLPGWVLGTAGAVQNSSDIRYGYALVAVLPDGTLKLRFREVTADMPPVPPGEAGSALTAFCYSKNMRNPGPPAIEGSCACGAVP
jgi:hypothetical protein